MWNKASFLISSVFNIVLDSLLQNKRKAYKRKDGVKPSLPADGMTTSAEHPDGGIPLLTRSDTEGGGEGEARSISEAGRSAVPTKDLKPDPDLTLYTKINYR